MKRNGNSAAPSILTEYISPMLVCLLGLVSLWIAVN